MSRQQQLHHRSKHYSISSSTEDSFKDLNQDGRIQIGDRLGVGMYAHVYRGQMWTQGGYKPVAIKKFLHGTSQPELCQKEITVLKKINKAGCENLVKYYTEVTTDNRNLHLVLEYCNLGDLYSQLQKGPFHFRVIQHFLKQICSALRVLHDHKIMHRDIKPQNILLHCDRPIQSYQQNWEHLTVKLADFGLSGILSEARMCFSICGSPIYMAPEIMLASENSLDFEGYGPQADLFSLGVTLFQLATNDFPFPSRYCNQQRIAEFHRNYRITKTTGVNPDLDNLILGLLDRDVDRRTSLDQMEKHRFLQTVYPAAPASPKVTPTKRTVEEHEESKCYGWANHAKRERERQRKLRQLASESPQVERPCEVIYHQIKPGDPFEDLEESSEIRGCRRLPSAPVPIPRGQNYRRRSSTSSRDSSLFGSIIGSVHYHASGLLGSIIPKPRVRHEVGDASRFAQLDVQESHEDDFVVICEKEKPKPKPKPVYRYERIATTRPAAEDSHQHSSRKSGLREESKQEDHTEKPQSPETTTKKLKKLKSVEKWDAEPVEQQTSVTQISEAMFTTAADDFDFNEGNFTVSQLSDDLFSSCCGSSLCEEEVETLQPKQRANSVASIDSGVSVGSVDSLSLIPFGLSKVDQFVEQIWDNRSEVKRESFCSISDPRLANLLRVLNPVLEYEAGLQKAAPFEGDFFKGVEKILKNHERYTMQPWSKADCDADIFRNAALLFGQSLQRAGNDREQWCKLLHILEIFEQFSTHDTLRRGFRAMYEKMSEHNTPLMLN